jgi:hypothetical protein
MNSSEWPTYKGWPQVILPAWLYDIAEAEGHDMGYYIKQQPIPTVANGQCTTRES